MSTPEIKASIINTPNVNIGNSQSSSVPVTQWKPCCNSHSRIYLFSIDFCKKETWYVESTQVSNEIIGTGNGSITQFDLAHGSGFGEAIIDLCHGKVTDENLITPPSGSPGGYIPIVTVSGIQLQEREMYEATGGDYEIDYIAGKITFYSPPASGEEILASYYYSPADHGPIIMGGPSAGKRWIIDAAEAQFSSDIVLTDTMLQNIVLDYPVFDGSGNYLYTIYDMKATTDAIYTNAGSFLDFCWGSLPTIPAWGGSERGMQNETILLRWSYLTPIVLNSSLNMRVKIWSKHQRAFGGERATVVLYGLETDEV